MRIEHRHSSTTQDEKDSNAMSYYSGARMLALINYYFDIFFSSIFQ